MAGKDRASTITTGVRNRWDESLCLPPDSAGEVLVADPYGDWISGAVGIAADVAMAQDVVEPAAEFEEYYWLVEVGDGESPRLRRFSAVSDMLKYFAKIDGNDTYAFLFHGRQLPFTSVSSRQVFLSPMRLVSVRDERVELRPFSDGEVTVDGFLGDPNVTALGTFPVMIDTVIDAFVHKKKEVVKAPPKGRKRNDRNDDDG